MDDCTTFQRGERGGEKQVARAQRRTNTIFPLSFFFHVAVLDLLERDVLLQYYQ
jgi:hypothetical protein